jgi:hypothetical protein
MLLQRVTLALGWPGSATQWPVSPRRIFRAQVWFWCAAFALCGFTPFLVAVLAERCGCGQIVPAAATGSWCRRLLYWGFWLSAALLLRHFFLCYGLRRGRGRRALLLSFALLHNFTATRVMAQFAHGQQLEAKLLSPDIFERQWPNLRRLKMVNLPPAHLTATYADLALCSAELQSWSDLHRHVCALYAERLVELHERWPDLDERERKALFFMNFVSGLWSFGNRTHVDEPGCAACNEENHWSRQSQAPCLQTYLSSNIGCCVDYAYLLKSLLDHEGISNRLIRIAGHCFNEAHLAGRLRILDASINLYVDRSWERLYEEEAGPDSIRVLLFPHANLRDGAAPRYRSFAGHFRLLMLTRIANRPPSLRDAEYPALPPEFD